MLKLNDKIRGRLLFLQPCRDKGKEKPGQVRSDRDEIDNPPVPAQAHTGRAKAGPAVIARKRARHKALQRQEHIMEFHCQLK